MTPRAVIVDLSNLICRYHAVNPQVSAAQLSAAVRKQGTLHAATHLVCALDGPDNWREALFPGHKQGRAAKPPELRALLDAAREISLNAGAITVSAPQMEADDVIATVTGRYQVRHGGEVVIVSNDKDLFSLLRPEVSVITLNSRMTPELLTQKYRVRPEQWPLYRAVTGDTSDGHSGVPGLGPGAAVLICAQAVTAEDALARAREGHFQARHNALLLEHEKLLRLYETLAHLRVSDLIHHKEA